MTTDAGAGIGEDPLLAALRDAAAAVDRAAAAVTWRRSDDTVLHAVRRVAGLRARVEGLHLALVREVDGRGAAQSAPVATTVEGFLRTATLVGAAQARRDVAAARATRPGSPLEPFGTDLAQGRGTRAHLDVAVRCLDRVPEHLARRPGATGTIVDYLRLAACDAAPLDLDRAGRQLLARLDPDGSERWDENAYQRRFLDLHVDSTGMLVGRFQLDPEAGATLRRALEARSAPRPATDGTPDRRQARERRADALTELARTAMAVSAPVRGERPRVVVHVTPDQLRGAAAGLATVEGGGPVSTGTARRLSCDPVLQRVVLDPSAGPLDVGRLHRLVTLPQRRALEARDGGCVIPGCGAPPRTCDAHHVVFWADGGPTDVHNLCLLCPGHHTAVHAGTWQVHARAGRFTVVPPRWVDPARTERPVRHHVVRAATADLDPDLDLDLGSDSDPPEDREPQEGAAPAGPHQPPEPPGRTRAADPPGWAGARGSPRAHHPAHLVGHLFPVVRVRHVDLSTRPFVELLPPRVRARLTDPP